MSFSRWKMMAGVLGVSIGGLAAAASQCPKWDQSKGRSAEAPVAKAEPKLPPAGPPSTPAPVVPPAPELPPLPTPPQLVPAGPSPTPAPVVDAPKPSAIVLPSVPDFTPAIPDAKPPKPAEVTPASGTLPLLPDVPSAPVSSKPSQPAKPPAPIDLPMPGPIPAAPPRDPIPPAAAPKPPETVAPPSSGPDGRGLTGTPKFTGQNGDPLPLNPAKPMAPPVIGASGTQPTGPATPPVSIGSEPVGGVVPVFGGAAPAGVVPPPPPAANIDTAPSKPTVAPAVVAPAVAAAVKFRIVLRVGEGEPMFEVKNGDNLVLKVACDKVDIKSPEKGNGPSEVTARGKVRFAGFGAEGTCEELKFLAGTGEVQMTGEVKVQVKDKLGRVESELTAGTLKYKIDASAIAGTIKP